MITITEALKIIQDQQIELHSKVVDIDAALHYYLAEEVIAPFDVPSFDNSAMDGYAVCGSGNAFELVGEVAAGDITDQTLSTGCAMRIFTGAQIPLNTTAVIMQEHVEVKGKQVILQEEVVEGKNIRRRGDELAEGQQVFGSGHIINPATVGLLASLGVAKVEVVQKPTIGIIATGNELISPGESRGEGQIFESNTFALKGALQQHGWSCQSVEILPDDFERIKSSIASQLERSDVLLISGGISVGEYDFVKRALEANGVEQQFYKVLQKPGKPLYFGRRGDTFVFALPGNPASSLTCFYIYVIPLLERLSGGAGLGLKRTDLPLKESFHFKFDRPTFLKAWVDQGRVKILDGQGSSMIHSMAQGNALVFLEQAGKYKEGEPVQCILQ